MKKAIIFAVAVTLSGAAFASGFESLKSNLNLTSLNVKTIADTEIVIPAASQKVDISIVETGTKDYKILSFRFNGKKLVCMNALGDKGYNRVTVSEFLSNPKKGECADLRNTDMTGADLSEINLSGANLRGSNLKGVDLYKAILIKAELGGANLSGANLYNARLEHADMFNTNLSGANLIDANLSWANMYGANLSEANLNGANLRRTVLMNADLRGADLRVSNSSWTELEYSKYNDATQLPFSEEEAKSEGMIKVAD